METFVIKGLFMRPKSSKIIRTACETFWPV